MTMYGYAIGRQPEHFGAADYESREAAIAAASTELFQDGVGGPQIVTTCRAAFRDPAALLAQSIDVDELLEHAEEFVSDSEHWTDDDEYFALPETARMWLRVKLDDLCQQLAEKFQIEKTPGQYDATELVEHEVDVATIGKETR